MSTSRRDTFPSTTTLIGPQEQLSTCQLSSAILGRSSPHSTQPGHCLRACSSSATSTTDVIVIVTSSGCGIMRIMWFRLGAMFRLWWIIGLAVRLWLLGVLLFMSCSSMSISTRGFLSDAMMYKVCLFFDISVLPCNKRAATLVTGS